MESTKQHTPAYRKFIEELLGSANYFTMYRVFIFVLPDIQSISAERKKRQEVGPWHVFDISLQQFLRAHSPDSWDRISLESWLTRNVDGLLRYLTEVMFLIFTTRPECLKSVETITFREVLEHETIQDLVLTLAEHKVHELGYSGLRGIARYLNEKLGVSNLPRGDVLDNAVKFVEARNLIVHNKGIVNRVYLRRTGQKDLSEGDILPVTHELLLESTDVLKRFAEETDDAVVKHFGLAAPSSGRADAGR